MHQSTTLVVIGATLVMIIGFVLLRDRAITSGDAISDVPIYMRVNGTPVSRQRHDALATQVRSTNASLSEREIESRVREGLVRGQVLLGKADELSVSVSESDIDEVIARAQAAQTADPEASVAVSDLVSRYQFSNPSSYFEHARTGYREMLLQNGAVATIEHSIVVSTPSPEEISSRRHEELSGSIQLLSAVFRSQAEAEQFLLTIDRIASSAETTDVDYSLMQAFNQYNQQSQGWGRIGQSYDLDDRSTYPEFVADAINRSEGYSGMFHGANDFTVYHVVTMDIPEEINDVDIAQELIRDRRHTRSREVINQLVESADVVMEP